MAKGFRRHSPSTIGVLPNNIKEVSPLSGRDTPLCDPRIAVEQTLGPDGRLTEQPTILSAAERKLVGSHFRSRNRG